MDIQVIAERLRDIFDDFSHDSDPAELDRLRELYADDFFFQDPLQSFEGLDRFIEMNREIMKKARHARFAVHDVTTSDDVVMLTWTMEFTPKLGPRMDIEGATCANVRGV